MSVSLGEPAAQSPQPTFWHHRLVQHIPEAHGAQLGDSDLFESLDEQAAYVHAAMHSGRAHPGHFHRADHVLHLWDPDGRIGQVDTGGRT